MIARFAGTDNTVGNGFGIFFLFLFITFFAGGMDACKSPRWIWFILSCLLTQLSAS